MEDIQQLRIRYFVQVGRFVQPETQVIAKEKLRIYLSRLLRDLPPRHIANPTLPASPYFVHGGLSFCPGT
jgi:hypothetical protein